MAVKTNNEWPADKIERRRVDDLIPYARNARTHSDEQIAQIMASITEWGWTTPVLIDDKGGIIAGHGRVMAARKLGIDEVPTVTATGWTKAQKAAYVLADNQLPQNAGWDMDLLKIEMQDLSADGFDLSLMGFGDDMLANMLKEETEGLTDPDAVPDVPDNPVTVDGDVWILGKHRLMCGDSTSIDAVDKLMNGVNADLCFTSPPYAQQRDYKKEISDWDGLMNGVFSIVPVKDGAQILVNLGLVHDAGKVNSYWDAWLNYMAKCGWPLFGWYVWDKGFGMPGNWNGRLAPAHEWVFHFSKGGNKPANKWVDKQEKYIGKRSGKKFRQKDGSTKEAYSPETSLQPTKVADSVIRITPQMARNIDTSHPAMFPVALCEHIYKSYAKAGDIIYEPFSGSGTSIIACENMGMNCAAMELAPEYTDIAVKRWQNFTGKDAILERTGDKFSDLKK